MDTKQQGGAVSPVADTVTFALDGRLFDIPMDRAASFVTAVPGAKQVQSFQVGERVFDIPLDRVEEFTAKVPNAQPLFQTPEDTPQVTPEEAQPQVEPAAAEPAQEPQPPVVIPPEEGIQSDRTFEVTDVDSAEAVPTSAEPPLIPAAPEVQTALLQDGLDAVSERTFEVTSETVATPLQTRTRRARARQAKMARDLPEVLQETEDVLTELETNFERLDVDQDPDLLLIAKDELPRAEAALRSALDHVDAALSVKFDGKDNKPYAAVMEGLATEVRVANTELTRIQEQAEGVVDDDERRKLEKEFNEIRERAAGKAQQLQTMLESPEFQTLQKVVEQTNQITEARLSLFTDQKQFEAKVKQTQAATDADYEEYINSKPGLLGRAGEFTKNLYREGGVWLRRMASSVVGISAAVDNATGLDRRAQRTRTGLLRNIDNSIELSRALIPSAIKGDPFEITADAGDEVHDVVFSETGRPLFLRNKETGTQSHIPSERAADLSEKFIGANLEIGAGRTIQSGVQSMYDMVAAILVTRGLALGARGAASAAVKNLIVPTSIAGTTTFQVFGDEYLREIEQGSDPDQAAIQTFSKAGVTGLLEASLGKLEGRLATQGLLTPAVRSGLRETMTTSLSRAVRDKLSAGDVLANFWVLAGSVVKSLKGEVGEEIVQQIATDNIDQIADGAEFKLPTLLEAQNIAMSTAATVFVPALVSGRGARRNHKNSIVNASILNAIEENNYNQILAEMAATKQISVLQAQTTNDNFDYVRDELNTLSEEVDGDARIELTGLILDRRRLEAQELGVQNPNARAAIARNIEQLNKRINDIKGDTETVNPLPEITRIPENAPVEVAEETATPESVPEEIPETAEEAVPSTEVSETVESTEDTTQAVEITESETEAVVVAEEEQQQVEQETEDTPEKVQGSQVFLHGTSAVFTEFDDSKLGQTGEIFGLGHHFTSSPDKAKSFGENVLRVEADISDNLDLDNVTDQDADRIVDALKTIRQENERAELSEAAEAGIRETLKEKTGSALGVAMSTEFGDITEIVKKAGYRGISIPSIDEHNVFSSEDIGLNF